MGQETALTCRKLYGEFVEWLEEVETDPVLTICLKHFVLGMAWPQSWKREFVPLEVQCVRAFKAFSQKMLLHGMLPKMAIEWQDYLEQESARTGVTWGNL